MPAPCPSLPISNRRKTLFAAALALGLGTLVLGLSACAQFPELDATVPQHLRDADYPALVPLDGSLTSNIAPRQAAQPIESYLTARRDRLQRRARALRATIIDSETRKRMQDGISR